MATTIATVIDFTHDQVKKHVKIASTLLRSRSAGHLAGYCRHDQAEDMCTPRIVMVLSQCDPHRDSRPSSSSFGRLIVCSALEREKTTFLTSGVRQTAAANCARINMVASACVDPVSQSPRFNLRFVSTAGVKENGLAACLLARKHPGWSRCWIISTCSAVRVTAEA